MKEVLRELIEIFQPNGIDWMGYEQTTNNPYTYRCIKSTRDGGLATINNGAILTINSNWELNVLDNEYNKVYNELKQLFKELNTTKRPPTNDYYERVEYILKKTYKRK